jgi:DNA-binding CsgD family transcriptional regulator
LGYENSDLTKPTVLAANLGLGNDELSRVGIGGAGKRVLEDADGTKNVANNVEQGIQIGSDLTRAELFAFPILVILALLFFGGRAAVLPVVVGITTGLDELTPREREILALVGRGLSNHEIAEHLVLSPLTAKTHVSRLFLKLGARDRAQLVVIAYETGLVTVPSAASRTDRAAHGRSRLVLRVEERTDGRAQLARAAASSGVTSPKSGRTGW